MQLKFNNFTLVIKRRIVQHKQYSTSCICNRHWVGISTNFVFFCELESLWYKSVNNCSNIKYSPDDTVSHQVKYGVNCHAIFFCYSFTVLKEFSEQHFLFQDCCHLAMFWEKLNLTSIKASFTSIVPSICWFKFSKAFLFPSSQSVVYTNATNFTRFTFPRASCTSPACRKIRNLCLSNCHTLFCYPNTPCKNNHNCWGPYLWYALLCCL